MLPVFIVRLDIEVPLRLNFAIYVWQIDCNLCWICLVRTITRLTRPKETRPGTSTSAQRFRLPSSKSFQYSARIQSQSNLSRSLTLLNLCAFAGGVAVGENSSCLNQKIPVKVKDDDFVLNALAPPQHNVLGVKYRGT